MTLEVTVPGPTGMPPVTLFVSDYVAKELPLLDSAFEALYAGYESTHNGTEPNVVVYTPAGLTSPQGTHSSHGPSPSGPNPADLYVENFAGVSGTEYDLQPKANGMVVTGTGSVEIMGRAAQELLVGNGGNDTIKGHGGTGTIMAGSGNNAINTGNGNMDVVAWKGNDTIHAGNGMDTITTYGNATIYGEGGSSSSLLYTDDGGASKQVSVVLNGGNATLYAGAGYDQFTGSSSSTGLTLMYNGTGNDTFTGGSGLTIENLDSTASTDVNINSFFHGDTIVEGFSGNDSITLAGYTVNQLLADTTVTGGNSYVNMGDGTKLVFVGVDITKDAGQIS